MTTANTSGDGQHRVSAKGPPFVIAAIGCPEGNVKPGTLRISVETACPDRDAEGLPRKTEHAHGGRLVFTKGERPRRLRSCT